MRVAWPQLSAGELANALTNTDVVEIVWEGNISISQADLSNGNWPAGGISLPSNHNVTLRGANGPATLDLGGLASVITVSSNATLRLNDIVVSGVASRYLLDHPQLETPWGLDGYPSIVAQPNSTMELYNVTMYYPGDDCSAAYMQSHYGAFVLQFGQSATKLVDPISVSVTSDSFYDVPLTDTRNATKPVVATSHFLIQRSVSICFRDPLYNPPSPPAVTAQAPGPPPKQGSSRLAWYWILLIVLLILFFFAKTFICGWWLLKRKKRKQAKAGDPATEADDDLEKGAIKPVKTTEWMPGPWNVRHGPVEGLLVGEMLGRGSYGRVYKGTWKGSEVAIKVIEFRANSDKSVSISLESVLSTAVCHPCVVNTYKICTTPITSAAPIYSDSAYSQDSNNMSSTNGSSGADSTKKAKGGKSQLMETWMVLEYCDKGSLEEALDNKWLHSPNVGLPDMASIYRCLLDIAGGMDYLHSVSILHGDLKTANVLLKSSNDDTRGYICKLADFGLSRLLDGSQTHISTQSYGTITHMPAELLRNGKMTRAVDVYSFGMLMWELCTGLPLYGGMTAPEVYHKVVYEGHRPEVPAHCPEAYAALMQRCWAEDPEGRPTFDEVTKALQPLSDSVGPGSAPPRRVSLAPDEAAQAAQTFRQALGDDSARAASPET
ncbi:hypothetical protein WJX72_001463 [[Myrmecia] bisecta]|uniref:Protein kinase domain-containing protein n=1 Tax=[Myrmecia] bisecta TaxID=41462 RepID=A0AAW1QAZ6_9CHLO